ncbi:MAG: LytTR family DNA-binding domain-containing protein [Crocinitomicaceae bacterium]|nr:LytTR family DNA-binding domain-containing protein [Crocinitomicaceae bacterium]
MEILKVLIVDDETNARAALRGMIENNFSNIEIVGEAASVPDAVKAIHKLKPNVVLLDIEMPGYLGIDILDFFDAKDIDFKIIFITAYNDYALQAFDIAAVDYLLKPTRIDQLNRAFDRIKNTLDSEASNYLVLKENLESRGVKKIAVSSSSGVRICDINDIRNLKADGSYTHFHFVDNEKLTVSKNLQEYGNLEKTGSFYRVNRSYIVNINLIVRINKKDGGGVVMDNGEEIAVSAEKRNYLLQFFKENLY